MNHKIVGDNLQIVTLEISEGETVYGEAGSMVYMSPNMEMEAKSRGGILKGLGRKLAGETFFMTEFSSAGGTAIVAFAGNAPGKIQAWDLSTGTDFMAQKDAFLCADDGVDMKIAFQKRLGATFFGGEGFILQRLSGDGTAFVHACGDFIEMELGQGERLKVDTGSVVGWEATVDYDIERVKGIKTMLFGGEGLFITRLEGPGKVLLQSMTLKNLAMALAPFMPQQGQTSGKSGLVGTLIDESLS